MAILPPDFRPPLLEELAPAVAKAAARDDEAALDADAEAEAARLSVGVATLLCVEVMVTIEGAWLEAVGDTVISEVKVAIEAVVDDSDLEDASDVVGVKIEDDVGGGAVGDVKSEILEVVKEEVVGGGSEEVTGNDSVVDKLEKLLVTLNVLVELDIIAELDNDSRADAL